MNCRRIERSLRVQIKEQSYTTVISSQIKVHGHWTFFPQPKSCKCILQSLWYLPAFFFSLSNFCYDEIYEDIFMH